MVHFIKKSIRFVIFDLETGSLWSKLATIVPSYKFGNFVFYHRYISKDLNSCVPANQLQFINRGQNVKQQFHFCIITCYHYGNVDCQSILLLLQTEFCELYPMKIFHLKVIFFTYVESSNWELMNFYSRLFQQQITKCGKLLTSL